MKLVLAFYEKSVDALNKGADMNALIAMPVREKIGRYKYTTDADIESEYKNVEEELVQGSCGCIREGGLLIMPKEYRTIQEVAGPLMLVRGVENVAYDELGRLSLQAVKAPLQGSGD